MLKLQTAFLLLYSVSAGIRQISDKYLVQQPGRTPLIIEKVGDGLRLWVYIKDSGLSLRMLMTKHF